MSPDRDHILLDARGISQAYVDNPEPHELILDNLNIQIRESEFVSIVGPSGCGKTTMLRTLSGLMPPLRGTVSLDGKSFTRVPEGLAMVFQDYRASLFPWKTVAGNIDFPIRGVLSKQERQLRCQNALEAVGLAGLGHRYPWQLSGGMQQRVSIARALVMQPRLLVMDEPFASVDAQTRADLEDLLLRVQADFQMTILFVTHDVDESVYLSTRVLALSKTPTVVNADIQIDLDYPRDQIATRGSAEFVRLRSELAKFIRHAVSGGVSTQL